MNNTNNTALMTNILKQHLPPQSVDYCLNLWQQYQFDFIVTRPRSSKLGDFCAKPLVRERITVNNNLNPYNFLITYLHEVAHLEVFRNYKRRQPAHGKAWKTHFRNLLLPIMTEENFPASVLLPLLHYAQNPKASTTTDMPLMHALRSIDIVPNSNRMMLSDLAEGERFKLQGKIFTKSTTRRTRAFCIEQATQKRYLVSCIASVEPMP
jgi:SprT protein